MHSATSTDRKAEEVAGVTLTNVFGEQSSIALERWESLLATAEKHGWVPEGTLPPASALDTGDSPKWNAAYFPACGQQIRRSDAAALAAILITLSAREDCSLRDIGGLPQVLARSGCLISTISFPDSTGLLNLSRATAVDTLAEDGIGDLSSLHRR
jgi:hypothetical protein